MTPVRKNITQVMKVTLNVIPPTTKLKNDIIEVIRKYVPGAGDRVDVKLERGADISTLEIDIELPAPQAKPKGVTRATTPAFAR